MAPVNGQTSYMYRLSNLDQRLRQDPGLPRSNPTSSYWQLPPCEAFSPHSSSLAEDSDIVIIGSGITGCSVAKHVLEGDPSVRVTILEARDVCSGATGRNGGHIKAVPENSYPDNVATLGLEKCRQILHFTLNNVEALLNLSATLPVSLQKDSEVRRVDSLNLFTDPAVFEEFKTVVGHFETDNPDLKGRGVFVTADELRLKHGVNNAVGGYKMAAAAAWPYRLITGMLSDLLEKHKDRLTIEEQTPVESVEYAQDMYRIVTSRGVIRAKTVIHATNGHASHLLGGLRGPLFPVRGQMSTQLPSESFGNKYNGERSWSIHYDSGFDYITQSRSGEIFHGGGLAQSIQRGLGELGNTRDDENSVQAMAHLGGALNATFGIEDEQRMSSQVKACWTGVMGFTSDGLPLVGRVPKEASLRDGQGEWVSAGFNGYGMVNTWLAGKHIAESVLGRSDPEPIPDAYNISGARICGMSSEDAAKNWIAAMGVD